MILFMAHGVGMGAGGVAVARTKFVPSIRRRRR